MSAEAKVKRPKRIVQIKLETPKKRAVKVPKKRKKSVLVKHRRDHEVEVEPLKNPSKVKKRGVMAELHKKRKKRYKKRSVASEAMKKSRLKRERQEDESQLKDQDLDELLKNMKGSSETELLTEYEGSF